MTFRLEEDLLDLKEPPVCFLDLQGLKIKTQDELQFALKKIPDLKLRKEKIVDEEIVPAVPVVKKKAGFNNTPLPAKTDDSVVSFCQSYGFENPIPDGMRGIKLRDVAQVEIDWKMLTLDRPKTKLDEEIYSRFVELDRLKLKTMATEAPRVLFGGKPSAATLLPTQAPGHKKKKKSKKGKVAKAKGSGSEEDEVEETANQEDDDDDETPGVVTQELNEKFTYEHYARYLEEKDDNEDADLADENQEVPEKKEKPKTARTRRSRKSTKDIPKTESKLPNIPITVVNPPSPVPSKATVRKKTKTKPKCSKSAPTVKENQSRDKKVKGKSTDDNKRKNTLQVTEETNRPRPSSSASNSSKSAGKKPSSKPSSSQTKSKKKTK